MKLMWAQEQCWVWGPRGTKAHWQAGEGKGLENTGLPPYARQFLT